MTAVPFRLASWQLLRADVLSARTPPWGTAGGEIKVLNAQIPSIFSLHNTGQNIALLASTAVGNSVLLVYVFQVQSISLFGQSSSNTTVACTKNAKIVRRSDEVYCTWRMLVVSISAPQWCAWNQQHQQTKQTQSSVCHVQIFICDLDPYAWRANTPLNCVCLLNGGNNEKIGMSLWSANSALWPA